MIATYASGSIDPVVELLAGDVVWHVPGESPIAGDHRGVAQVIDYFERRRQLASATMRMRPGKAIVEGDAVAQLVEGSALLDDERVSWKTIGIYRVDIEHRWIREVWLVPLDSNLFDRIWKVFSDPAWARDYSSKQSNPFMEAAGIEPATSWVRSRLGEFSRKH